MDSPPLAPPAATRPASPALLLALMAASGAAGLVYQLTWFQELTLVVGSSAVSLSVLLTMFLGGLGVGSALGAGRSSSAPLKRYARIELGVGALGLVSLYLIPLAGGLYDAAAIAGTGGLPLRALVTAACLLPATVLMGMTLPIVSAAVPTDDRRMRFAGLCYAANTGGAVIGSLIAGFYLLGEFDARVATIAAATLNLAVAAAAGVLARRTEIPPAASTNAAARAPLPRSLYAATVTSGFVALLAEVIWTRHLALVLGGSVYTLALVLAVFLLALAVGSAAGTALGRRFEARAALALCLWLQAGGIASAAALLAWFLPYWPLDVTLPIAPAAALGLDLVRTALVVAPGALLFGASFTLVLAAAQERNASVPHTVGGLYAANTCGAISGALATTFVLVPLYGSAAAQRLAVAICAGMALWLTVTLAHKGRHWRVGASLATLAAAGIAATLPTLPPEFVAYGRFLPTRGLDANVVYVGEGRTATVAVSQEPSGILTYHNAGKTQASTYPQDLRLQRMLGHLATLLTEQPANVLVIGLGAGVTAGAVSLDPAVERVVVAEIEPLAAEVAARYFAAANFGVLDNPRVQLELDDGRHWLTASGEQFDAITSDPLDPWVKGAAALYTREFWELCRERLNDGGAVTVFVQLYETTANAVQSELATFFNVFPNGLVFANTVEGLGYDLVLVGRRADTPIDLTQLLRRLARPDYARVTASLRSAGFDSGLDLLSTFAVRGSDLDEFLAGAALNTDRNLRLQYLAGRGVNVYDAAAIYSAMLAGERVFPADVFAGAPAELEELRQRFAGRAGSY